MGAYSALGVPAFLALGLAVGALGTLVGAGGGFILVPILLVLLPNESADRITAVSMAVVFFNAASGTFAYARMRRIDFHGGWRFAAAALPGALLGALATNYVARIVFDRALGATLVAIAIFLGTRALRRTTEKTAADLADTSGDLFRLDAAMLRRGSVISAGVGFISSALGIGGGIVHVPALVYVLGYPIHRATATSHFVLACTTLVAVVEHSLHGSYGGNVGLTASIAGGAIVGAQIGAHLSKRLGGTAIILCLSAAILFAGTRIILRTM